MHKAVPVVGVAGAARMASIAQTPPPGLAYPRVFETMIKLGLIVNVSSNLLVPENVRHQIRTVLQSSYKTRVAHEKLGGGSNIRTSADLAVVCAVKSIAKVGSLARWYETSMRWSYT